MRRARVSGVLAPSIQRTQSRWARSVSSFHNDCAAWDSAKAARRSAGILSFGSRPNTARFTVSPARAPDPASIALFTRSELLPDEFKSSGARNGWPLIVPSIVAMPRNFLPTASGRSSATEEPVRAACECRASRALKRSTTGSLFAMPQRWRVDARPPTFSGLERYRLLERDLVFELVAGAVGAAAGRRVRRGATATAAVEAAVGRIRVVAAR